MKAVRSITVMFLAIILVCQATFAQFKNTAGGFAFESKAVFAAIGYSKAGGGVILHGRAKPDENDKAVLFTDANIVLSNGLSTIFFNTDKCPVKYSSNYGIMKDAVTVVNNERGIIRDVNLLSIPDTVQEEFHQLIYPTSKYFYVELNKDLIGTKTGENLLLVDLIQTDPEFYSDSSNVEQYYKFTHTLDSLTINSLHSLLWRVDSSDRQDVDDSLVLAQTSYMNKLSKAYLYNELFEKNDTDYAYTKMYFKKMALSSVSCENWTYNDENTADSNNKIRIELNTQKTKFE